MNVKLYMSYHVNYTQIIAWQTRCSKVFLVTITTAHHQDTGKQGP